MFELRTFDSNTMDLTHSKRRIEKGGDTMAYKVPR